MSAWTRERHEEARSIGFGFSFYEPGITELVADAVTEIERLRAENAKLTVRAEAAEKRASNAAWARDYDHQGGI